MNHHFRPFAFVLGLILLGSLLTGCADTFVAGVDETAPRTEQEVPPTLARSSDARATMSDPADTEVRSQAPPSFKAATETSRLLQRYRIGRPLPAFDGYALPSAPPDAYDLWDFQADENGLPLW